MPATFILSLDCEGKWGVADHLTATDLEQLSNERLTLAYQSILQLLDEFEVPATFAFVGAFTQSPAAFARLRPQLEALARYAPGYLKPALQDIDATGGAGWHGDELIGRVGAATVGHEIALHGVTHVPWTSVDANFAREELLLWQSLEGPVTASATFVYPRNEVAHVDVLEEFGMAGFRAARPHRSRAASLLSEFDLWATPEPPRKKSSGIIGIPAGFFLNWRSGPRALVPPALTIARARHLLDSAARAGGVVHYWLHPENIASAPSTLDLLRGVIREVAKRRDAGHCQVLTQLGYCRWLESQF